MNSTPDGPNVDRWSDAQDTTTERRRSWMPWIGGTRPNTTTEEAMFVMRLGHFAGHDRGAHERSDVTAVLNAIRCGLLVDELFERAPGLRADRLYGAYHALEVKRRRSERAWSALIDDPTVESVEEFGPEAAKLLPSLVGRLYAVADSAPDELAPVVAEMASSVRSTGACVAAIEHAMQLDGAKGDQRADLQQLLYDPAGDGATSRPDFLSLRVGTLVPARVAALLGEHVDVTARPVHGRLSAAAGGRAR